jgi:uncharacterized protein YggU (UPF0235/DUF167 family)
VYVIPPAEDGRANQAIIEAIAGWLGVKRRQVEILTGQTSRNKVISVSGILPQQLADAIAKAR